MRFVTSRWSSFFRLATFLAAICFVNAVVAKAQSTQPWVDGSPANGGGELSPDISTVLAAPNPPQPPTLRDRPPIPTPPPVALPSSAASLNPKPSLSWRAKAYALGNETPSATSNNKLCWSLPISFDKSQPLLTSALNQTGFQLIASYAEAGHYLAKVNSDGSDTQVIIVVQPLGATLTSFQLRLLPEGRRRYMRRIEELPRVMNTILENRGVL